MSTLNQSDIDRLAAEPSSRVRAETAGKVGALLGDSAVGPRERAVAMDIFRVMARDAEIQVRAALAASVRSNPSIPRDIALRLAGDVEQVSVPLLQFSPILTDDDLVAIIQSDAVAKQSAIAARVGLSGAVADVLVDRAAPAAVAVLLGNESAAVSEGALERSLNRLGTEDVVQFALAHRKQLPVSVAERLVALASDSLRDYVATHHKLTGDVADELVLDARERAVLGLSGDAANVAELVGHLDRNDRLTEAVVLRALCTGDLDFFEHALARLAEIPVTNCHRLIQDPAGLTQLLTRCGFSREFRAIAKLAVGMAQDLNYDGSPHDRERYSAHVIERILTQFGDSFASDNADYLLQRLARAAAADSSASAAKHP